MSFWNRIASAFRPKNDLQRDDPRRYMQNIPYQLPAGVVVTMDSALQLSVVWGCVMAITNAIAPLPWNVFDILPDGRRRLVADDPLGKLLSVRPNPEMTAIAFREAMLINSLTWGNSYAEIVRSRSGKVGELWPLMPDRTWPVRNRESGRLEYIYQQEMGGWVTLQADQVYHLRGPGITGLMGDNMVARASKTLGLLAAQERFASVYYGNNSVVGGVLEYPKTLTDSAFKRLKDDLEDKHKGPDRAFRPLILEGGMVWKPQTANAQESQVLDSRRFSIEDICRWYGVPPHKVQHLDRATFNNIEHLSMEFYNSALKPWNARMEQEADHKLTPAPNRITALDASSLTRGDFKTRAEGYQVMRRIGVYSANDILHREGENGIGPEGDIRIVESNMQPMKQLGFQKAPEIYQYHIDAGIPTVNEVRERLQLPPIPEGDVPANAIKAAQEQELQDSEQKQLPEKPAQPQLPPPPEEQPKEKPSSNNLLMESVALLLGSTFERYSRRLANRSADLRSRKFKRTDFNANMSEERERQRPLMLEECREVVEILQKAGGKVEGYDALILSALDNIDTGVGSEGEEAWKVVREVLPLNQSLPAEMYLMKTFTEELARVLRPPAPPPPAPPEEMKKEMKIIRDQNGVVIGATFVKERV